MGPVRIDPAKVHEFATAASFYRWLGKHHDKADELWIKIHKVDSPFSLRALKLTWSMALN